MKLEPPIVDVMIKDLNSIILSHSEQSENVRDLQKIEEEISKFFEGNFGLLPTSKSKIYPLYYLNILVKFT